MPSQRATRYALRAKLKHGFTLIELLVVISIIGILVTMTLSSYGRVQAKTRDTQRKNDFDQIAKAIQSYVGDNGAAPVGGANYGAGSGTCTGTAGTFVFGCALTSTDGATIYMTKLPDDPRRGSNTCGSPATQLCRYYYWASYTSADIPGWTLNAGCSGKPRMSVFLEGGRGNTSECIVNWNDGDGLYQKSL